MNETDLQKVAQAWVTMHLAAEDSQTYDENFWSYEAVSEMCDSEPEQCLAVIELILSLSDDDKIVSNLAAGPVEDLLVKHGSLVIKPIIASAKSHPLWKRMLGAVWKNDIQDSVWLEVQAVAGANAVEASFLGPERKIALLQAVERYGW